MLVPCLVMGQLLKHGHSMLLIVVSFFLFHFILNFDLNQVKPLGPMMADV